MSSSSTTATATQSGKRYPTLHMGTTIAPIQYGFLVDYSDDKVLFSDIHFVDLAAAFDWTSSEELD